MTNKDKAIKEIKQEKTIRVKTLVTSLLVAAAILGSFIGGWMTRSNFDATIKAQVSSQVRELTASKN